MIRTTLIFLVILPQLWWPHYQSWTKRCWPWFLKSKSWPYRHTLLGPYNDNPLYNNNNFSECFYRTQRFPYNKTFSISSLWNVLIVSATPSDCNFFSEFFFSNFMFRSEGKNFVTSFQCTAENARYRDENVIWLISVGPGFWLVRGRILVCLLSSGLFGLRAPCPNFVHGQWPAAVLRQFRFGHGNHFWNETGTHGAVRVTIAKSFADFVFDIRIFCPQKLADPIRI